jgi:hypothetical protein
MRSTSARNDAERATPAANIAVMRSSCGRMRGPLPRSEANALDVATNNDRTIKSKACMMFSCPPPSALQTVPGMQCLTGLHYLTGSCFLPGSL